MMEFGSSNNKQSSTRVSAQHQHLAWMQGVPLCQIHSSETLALRNHPMATTPKATR